MAAQPDNVKGSFATDPISALGLPTPVSIGIDATVGEALAAVQKHGEGYVLVVENERQRGILSERDVLMKIVARDVKRDTSIAEFMTRNLVTLDETESIARAIKIMVAEGVQNIPVVDKQGSITAVLRTADIIHFLAEAFPAQLLNLPPMPHQTMPKPEGG